ncbi:hypothetical protein FOPG_14777 [Fusarium oxysporum f. sp. conglutinans race 2 54008]|uniref:Uncharacterized protein n=1 Tax=Fusarium oxysporum f. sp. conglutinans race 2 54008 TaxID=1089457 RepID=X0HBL2_FUSOX|nr:hypothetical protein FOPG_14777 [Fusarium oxysporum f. sp. conglutinans race 2 54008]
MAAKETTIAVCEKAMFFEYMSKKANLSSLVEFIIVVGVDGGTITVIQQLGIQAEIFTGADSSVSTQSCSSRHPLSPLRRTDALRREKVNHG